MAVTPLTDAQRGAATPSCEPAASSRCRWTCSAAALGDLPNVKHPQNIYNLAYDAAHDVGEAMLAAYGYRTRHGSGQHDALGRYLAAIFDASPENAASRHFDQMRRDRNRQRYDPRPTTAAAAGAAAAVAVELHRAGAARM